MAFAGLPLYIIILGLLIWLAVRGWQKGASGLKLMLLGLNLILFGGIIAVDPDSNLGGFEYLLALGGLVVSLVGLSYKD